LLPETWSDITGRFFKMLRTDSLAKRNFYALGPVGAGTTQAFRCTPQWTSIFPSNRYACTVRGPISHNGPMRKVPSGNKLLVTGTRHQDKKELCPQLLVATLSRHFRLYPDLLILNLKGVPNWQLQSKWSIQRRLRLCTTSSRWMILPLEQFSLLKT